MKVESLFNRGPFRRSLKAKRKRKPAHICEHPGCTVATRFRLCARHRVLEASLDDVLNRLRKRPAR